MYQKVRHDYRPPRRSDIVNKMQHTQNKEWKTASAIKKSFHFLLPDLI